METWIITANVRQREAIGIFYPKSFTVTVPTGSSEETVRDQWFVTYGQEWEPMSITGMWKQETPVAE